jgi:hypothetical protein
VIHTGACFGQVYTCIVQACVSTVLEGEGTLPEGALLGVVTLSDYGTNKDLDGISLILGCEVQGRRSDQ